MNQETIATLIQSEKGLVGRRIFSDQDIYWAELERIFARCWLFVGHESMIPNPGDYMTSYMGEDSVIAWRDFQDKVHVFLNTCPHRGNKVCLFDKGSAKTLTCSYHGWSFDPTGALVGVPFYREAYNERLDKAQLGLKEVAKLAAFGGLIFATWDSQAVSLEEYLGDMRWYLEKIFIVSEKMGGLEVLPGRQSYIVRGNWKVPSENEAGDHYHTYHTHRSTFKVGNKPWREQVEGVQVTGPFEVALPPAHGLGGLLTGDGAETALKGSLAEAEKLGPEAVEYVKDRYRQLQERTKEVPAKPCGFTHANIFPNFSLDCHHNLLRARGLYLWHPRGPQRTEAWGWIAVERHAPEIVKKIAADQLHTGQSVSGLFLQDDYENFERVSENTRTPLTKTLTFNYSMGLECEGDWPGKEKWMVQGLPGVIGPRFTEHGQRLFYRYWAKCMSDEGAP
jgi:phenylpropionate dioxygenase-like ring-hydroxylating dioxygenase large terminal subunit